MTPYIGIWGWERGGASETTSYGGGERQESFQLRRERALPGVSLSVVGLNHQKPPVG